MLHSIRVLGSAALALCHVAMGVAEAYHIDGLQCWDVAAGALIVTEAGGTVMDSTGIFSRVLTYFYKWSHNLSMWDQ
jgi:Archaeal fructose-1,6-bisphosphatase and related enzymes of inositol monophosphatase family